MIVPLAAKKAFAAIVITLCLGLQVYAIVWLTGGRWFPFVDYRMFSKSYSVGATFQAWELRGRACEESSKTWPVTAHMLRSEVWRHQRRLRDIGLDRPRSARSRSELTQKATTLAARAAMPIPCAFQVWERAVIVTRDGLEPSSPDWVPRREWRANDPGAVRPLTGHPPAR